MIDRPPSPYLEEVVPGEPMQYVLKREKIHRIRCRQQYFAVVTEVFSPSEIWVRLLNHTADKFIIPSTAAPKVEESIEAGVYVWAPWDSETLKRARILHVAEEDSRALVRFIDHGRLAWRDKEVLFEMKSGKDEIRCYPWQAIPIVLADVQPAAGKKWSDEEIATIKGILMAYPYVSIIPHKFTEFVHNNDADYMRAEIYGLEESDLYKEDDTIRRLKKYDEFAGVSIAKQFNVISFPAFNFTKPLEAWDYPEYPILTNFKIFDSYLYERFNIQSANTEDKKEFKPEAVHQVVGINDGTDDIDYDTDIDYEDVYEL